MSSSPAIPTKRKSDGKLGLESGRETARKRKSSSGRSQKASLKGDVPPLGKFLASNHKATRDRAVDALRKFLSGQVGSEEDQFQDDLFDAPPSAEKWGMIGESNGRLDEIELAKLYKGLFYCYWMSDKPIVQQHLAQELADLCLIIRPARSSEDRLLDQVVTTQTALSFWKQFWVALGCEWQGVDKHRLDKYLLLMRRFVEVAFKILQRAHWHPKAIELWSEILKQTVLNVADFKTPQSITYHVSDIFLEELNRVLEKRPDRPAPIIPLLAPLIHGLSQSRPGTATFRKILENVFEPLFANLELFLSERTKMPKSSTIDIYPTFETSLLSSTEQPATSPPRTDCQAIRTDLLSLLFQAGSDPLCSDSNRKKIYNYWHTQRGIDDEEEADPTDEGK
ncbi:hypothetical protein PTTG_04328 [Puccinia triticina 1-1 BBBD Race 1]|uniref:Uncharacterized protein n=2 Tax=Puccinia triticina TaxID=208348 RepID=A0A180GPC6_PUCT1|nr:uncharacterized protein PtA15_1A1010 [Puccinia triticina]OAV94162.1 hypothetical protein PTTG_04328 [Puccinia triticina 1-1 BBBD Race 1]WAQ81668.1 hypothetical protein PtA15_1A1010 [Puccinia triticina]WAR52555.1 hypothetical protein PtB15_1B997 [Puccinia triticina]